LIPLHLHRPNTNQGNSDSHFTPCQETGKSAALVVETPERVDHILKMKQIPVLPFVYAIMFLELE